MKDKEKQIEEIFQDVAKVMCVCEDKERFFRPHRYDCRNCYMFTVIQHIVFFLRNSDYKKISENSVVLSREELEEKYEPSEKFMSVARELEDLKQNLEDKVVLSMEEYERLKGDNKYLREMIDKFRKDNTDIRKETAEKILKWLKDHCAFSGWIFVEAYFREQFGVEIKE